jgi:1-deoxy-D-xylulose-5-phosphate reductoisomerase
VTRRIGILGSTGSIGTQTLDVVRHFPDEFDVVALSTHTNTKKLKQQAEEFDVDCLAVSDPETAKNEAGIDTEESLRTIARKKLDILVVSVVGMAGLLPTLDALEEGTVVALASKEALVVGGELIRRAEKEHDGRILPLDSEHHAVFQLLRDENKQTVDSVYLTASGGPFLDRSRDSLQDIAPEEALDHPNWDMGPKITIDSATMMNKGLEVIEAKYLFDLEPESVGAVVHTQSTVHALVEFTDKSVKAHMSQPDMRQSIQSALFHPERRTGVIEALDFGSSFSLDFEPIDSDRFPAFRLANRALSEGGSSPTVLNAANAEAVRGFLDGQIAFLDIVEVVRECLEDHPFDREVSVDRVLEADRWTRERARTIMNDFN